MVFLPGTVFFKPPPSTPPLQPGKPWVFANFADIAKYKVNFPPYIVQTESINPAFTIYELAWGSMAASTAGHVSFMGRQATAYVVRVGLEKALASASGTDGDVFGRTLSSEISASGETSPTVTIEAWVDSGGSVDRCSGHSHRSGNRNPHHRSGTIRSNRSRGQATEGQRRRSGGDDPGRRTGGPQWWGRRWSLTMRIR